MVCKYKQAPELELSATMCIVYFVVVQKVHCTRIPNKIEFRYSTDKNNNNLPK